MNNPTRKAITIYHDSGCPKCGESIVPMLEFDMRNGDFVMANCPHCGQALAVLRKVHVCYSVEVARSAPD